MLVNLFAQRLMAKNGGGAAQGVTGLVRLSSFPLLLDENNDDTSTRDSPRCMGPPWLCASSIVLKITKITFLTSVA